jgi:hypothetical protein
MIQRIQSVYLLLAALSLFAFSYFQIKNTENHLLQINGWLAEAAVITSLATIFLYKNRKLQLFITRVLMALIMINIPILFLVEAASVVVSSLSTYFLFFGFIFLFFAHNGIDKDEKLIKSLDRLR